MSATFAEEPSSRSTLSGAIRVFLAESLLVPTGLLIAAYLARRLGPEGYGQFVVLAALVAWVEWSLTAMLARASVKFVSDAQDWRPIGSTVLSVHLLVSAGAALLLCLAATPVAVLLGAPGLAKYLQVFALDIPLFCLAQAHRNILVGLGRFTQRSLTAAARWISRLVLVIVLVELGLSIYGAILGSIGASLIELIVARSFVRPAFSVRSAFRVRNLWPYAGPLILSALALRLYDKLDLVALMALGGTAEEAGLYGAAQNLALLPSLFAMSISPLLLSGVSRALRDGNGLLAGRLAQHATRGVFLLLPLAAAVTGSADEIVALVFGQEFRESGTLLSLLIFGAVGLVVVSVTTAILTAGGRLDLTLALTGPLPLIALGGYLVSIPRAGPVGAALVTCLVATASAIAGIIAVRRVYPAITWAATAVRSALVCVLAYALAASWPTPGWLLLVKLLLISLALPAALVLLREFSALELAGLHAFLRRELKRPVPDQGGAGR